MSANPLPPLPTPGSMPGAHAAAGRFKPIDPVLVLRQHIKLLSVTAVVGVVVGVGVWFGLLTTVPSWASSAQLRVSEGIGDVGEVRTGDMFSGTVAAMESYIKSEVYKIQSADILTKALNDPIVRNSQWFADYKTDKGTPDLNKAREDLLDDHLSVSMIRGTQLINLTVSTPYEDDCQKIAQAIVDKYLTRVAVDTDNQVGGQSRSLVTEQNRVDQRIENLTTQIEEFTREHDLSGLDARLDEAAQVRAMLIEAREEKSRELNDFQKAYDAALEKQDAGGGPSAADILSVSEDQGIQLRDERLRSLREQREVSLHDFGEGHRILKSIDRQIAATEALRDSEIERLIRERDEAMLSGYKQAIEAATETIADYNDQILELEQKLVDLNLNQTRYANYQTELDEAKEARKVIEQSLSEVRLIKAMPGARPVQLQATPTLPELVFPRIEIIVPVVTGLMVVFVGGIVFVRELMDQSIKSPADIKLLKEAELLGILPHADEDPSGPSSVERVVEKYPEGLLAEAYRQVRTAVLGKMDRRGYKALLIAAAQPGAGASSVTHNLATSLAFNGRKVVVIDANFRRPSQHRFVDADNDRGLVDILLYGASLDDMLLTVQDPDLAVLPTGRAGDAPPELLEGARFHSLLGEIETRFDIVLIDAPPALLSSECQVLAKHVDAVIAVVRASSDKRGMIDRMVGQFDGQRADLLGVVLNGVQSSVGGYFRASFRDFYRYRQNGESANGKSNGRGRRQVAELAEPVDSE
jgi:polysaccharide biosynthesis transport protein